jgi:hypothetical protein
LVRTSWHLDHVAENILHIMVDRKQREWESSPGTKYCPQGHDLSDLFPLGRPHLLTVLKFSRTVPPAWDQEFITWAYIQTITSHKMEY